MPLLYTKKEHPKDAHEFAEISGYDGSIDDLRIPETIDGLIVEAIGNHAFSGRQDLVSISLPCTIKTLYAFAFHNCRKLKKISLFDSIDDYYDGVCRQCDSLTDIDITLTRGWYEVVRNFLADNDRTLRFMLHDESEGEKNACLTFPEYVYDFNENTMARTIQFSIAGSGMFYRECVDRRSINYHQYDSLFEKAVIDGNVISEDIALGRVLYPVELSDKARSAYETFIADNSLSILTRLIDAAEKEKEQLDTLKMLLKYKSECAFPTGQKNCLIPSDSIDEALKYASGKGLTEVCATLMAQGSTVSAATSKFIL